MRERLETWQATWKRRAITLPLLYLVGSLVLAALPLTTLAAVAYAPFERRRWAALRCVGFFTTYLTGEMLFLGVSFGQWLWSRPWSKESAERLAGYSEWLSNLWGLVLHESGQRFFGYRVEVRGLEALEGGGPVLVYLRHASLGDTPLSPVFLGLHAGLRVRYVAKRELRNDPIFDVIGTRLRACFVDRGSRHAAKEIDAICDLLGDLGPRDAVILYPEGTRFSDDKRARVLEQLAKSLPPALLQRAQRMRHVLPPRLGGPIAMLERNPGADVVFCTHVGFEGAATMSDLLSGGCIGKRMQVEFRRVPYAEIPKGRDALINWLFDEWAQLDAWIDDRSLPPDDMPALTDAA